MNWYQKYKGSISIDMDLHDFPFDRQEVKYLILYVFPLPHQWHKASEWFY